MTAEEILERCQLIQRLLLGKRSVFVEVMKMKDDHVITLNIFNKKGDKCKAFSFYMFLGDDYITKKWREVDRYVKTIK